MKLNDIKRINQRIYTLDTNISRSNKVIFIAALVVCLTRNKDFRNSSKLTELIDFNNESNRPIDQLIKLANKEIDKMTLQESTKVAVKNSFKLISGVNTKLDGDRYEFQKFISQFISEDFVSIQPTDLFFETLYMEIDKKANSSDDGIVLTPIFIAQLMIDLAEIDYKKDVVADLCSGTGLFSLLAYSKMLGNMDSDYKNGVITKEESDRYHKRLLNSIVANDNEPKMVTLCLANFLLKSLNFELLYCYDALTLEKSSFKIQDEKLTLTKAILNPPYEDKYKPLEIIEKNIQLVKDGNNHNKVVVIIPPQKFGQKKDVFSKILNIATLESVIKTQDDLFTDSGKSQPASIFVFDTSKSHNKNDIIHYYNFTDTGYIYLKDSGLVDKNGVFDERKAALLARISTENKAKKENGFVRSWTNFYDVNKELEIYTQIDPSKIKTDKEEADITLENITIKRMLDEKRKLIDGVGNNFKDEDGAFERYIIDILSED